MPDRTITRMPTGALEMETIEPSADFPALRIHCEHGLLKPDNRSMKRLLPLLAALHVGAVGQALADPQPIQPERDFRSPNTFGGYSRNVDVGTDTLNIGPLSIDTHLLNWGDCSPNVWDTVSPAQAYFCGKQEIWLPTGTLGVLYGQRIASYRGGAPSDADAPVTPAIGAYNQIQSTVSRANEVAALFKTDNYSYIAQGSGSFSQGLSWHGGRAWGLLGEAKELEETFIATAGQTVFKVPNGFNSVGAITRNGIVLAQGIDYVAASPNVRLSTRSASGDTIKIYRGDPSHSTMGAEIDIYGAAGTDKANALSGNRVGLGLFGYRADTRLQNGPAINIGTLLNIVADPNDSTLRVDRGITFQGQFARGIDFAASNASFSQFLMKFNGSNAGVSNGGTMLIIGDSNQQARVQATSEVGAVFGSDTDTDVVLWRFGAERLRLTNSAVTFNVPAILKSYTVAMLPKCVPAYTGGMAYVTDATAPTYNGALIGGGAVTVPVFCDGTAWSSH